MKTRSAKHLRSLCVLCWAILAPGLLSAAQTAPGLALQLYAGMSITGSVGTVYSVEYVTDLAQTNNASAWRCLEFLQLPASPYLWADKSAPATGKRFYRAVRFVAPGNLVHCSLGEAPSGGQELGLGQAESEVDPLIGWFSEPGVGGDLSPDLWEQGPADELGGALAPVDPAQLVVGSVSLRVVGIFAATVGFATDVVLLG